MDYAFAAPDTIPSGWVTLRMPNEGKETHYMEIDRLPKGKTYDAYRAKRLELDSLATLLLEGTIDTAEAVKKLRRSTPDWEEGGILDLGLDAGGVGLVGPGRTARTTLYLAPGTYVMHCHMPTAEGEWHFALGMGRSIVVTEAGGDASPPTADVTMRYRSDSLITEGTFRRGEQTVAFHVDEALGTEDGGARAGAHLARLSPDTDVEQVLAWVEEESFQNPAPTEFLGGADEIPAGQTAYVSLDLKPGRYAWVVYPFTSDPEIAVEKFRVE
ncbi:MAG: hypothetical protein ABEK84_00085 [Salinibacter sp.]